MSKDDGSAMPALDIISGISEAFNDDLKDTPKDALVDDETAADLEHSEGLESTVPKERVVWWKVYKLVPTAGGTSKRVFKQEIMDVSQIKDAELHVRDLAIERGWGSGAQVAMAK